MMTAVLRRRQSTAALLALLLLAARPAAAGQAAPAGGAAAPAAQVLRLVLEGHRFKPSELHADAGRPIVIELENRDDTPEEFESHALRKEFGTRAHQTGRFTIKPMPAGRYPFIGEFHADTARGVLLVE